MTRDALRRRDQVTARRSPVRAPESPRAAAMARALAELDVYNQEGTR